MGLRQSALLVLLGLLTSLSAQIDRSTLSGTVTDQSDARIAGAEIVAHELATGLERTAQTSGDGTYSIDSLPTGLYSVTFRGKGLRTLRFEHVEQAIGATRTLDAKLDLADVASQATVIDDVMPQMETSTASVGGRFTNVQVRELPLNGRNWAHLTALVPGAIDTGSSDQRSIRFAGHGLDDNNFTFDGVDASGVLNQAQKQYVRLAIPLDSINEFQVETQSFNADTGETGGAQIAVTSAFGTNALHGSAFDYLRNNVFDARSPFDPASPAPFILNQFGGSIGGAIVPNRMFYFADYEGLRQRRSQTQIGLVPSAGFVSSTLALSPSLAPVLSAFPQGSSLRSPNVANYIASANQVDNEDSGTLRLDQHFSDRTTGFLRFSGDEADYTIPTGVLNAAQNTDTKLKNGVAELFHVFSPVLVNELKFGVNQDQYHVASRSSVPFAVRISGFSPLTASNTSDGQGTTFNWLNDTTWIHGRHAVKFGVEYRNVLLNQGNSQNGTLTYISAASFQANLLDSASYTAQLPLKRLRKFKVFGYAQDEFKVTPRLTITAGIRYSFFNVLHELNNRAIPFDLETCGGYCPAGSEFSHPRYNDFDPRIGLAWQAGRTVVRAGGGLYHSDGQEDDQNLPYQNDVQRYTLSAIGSPGLSYPIQPYVASATGIVTPRDLYRNRKDFYISAWTASIERAVGNTVFGAAYAGNKGTNVLTTTYQNTVNPLTGLRPYPQFGPIEFRKNDSNSTFHSLQLTARSTFRHGLLFSANYMWSHSINDDGIGGGETDVPQNVSCRACEKASSDFDVRQIVNATAVYQLPFGAGRRYLNTPGLARTLFGGWQGSGVNTFRTGLPVNVTVDRANGDLPDQYAAAGVERPDLVPGVSLIPPGGQTPTQWINPAAFAMPAKGTWGNAGRNLVRGPKFWQTDLALAKTIPLTERVQLQCRAEVYNVFNRAQYGLPLADRSVLTNFGQITTPVNQGATGGGTPRQFQFALRFSF